MKMLMIVKINCQLLAKASSNIIWQEQQMGGELLLPARS